MRVDRALLADGGTALRSGPLRLFLVLELLAALLFLWRRGGSAIETILLVWSGLLILAFVAWWAGRHRLAHPQADPVPEARAKVGFAVVVLVGMLVWAFGLGAGGWLLAAGGLLGWTWAALRAGGPRVVARSAAVLLTRDPRPFVPLILLVALPKLLAAGPAFLGDVLVALPSGVGQQLLYLLGLYAPLEALTGRPAVAAVTAALMFGLLHVPIVLGELDGDLLASVANVILFQTAVGLIACLAFQRHRAALPIGAAHAIAIA
jgi:hypothetical protein